MKFYKTKLGSQTWLVPDSMATDEFCSACSKIGDSELGQAIELTEDEHRAVSNVFCYPYGNQQSFDRPMWFE